MFLLADTKSGVKVKVKLQQLNMNTGIFQCSQQTDQKWTFLYLKMIIDTLLIDFCNY